MGTVSDKLTYLEGTKKAIAQAIEAKEVSVPSGSSFRDYAGLIGQIQSGAVVKLQDGTATPTGEEFVLNPDEGFDGFSSVSVVGDYNLTPENIAEGITIYGVEGTLKIGASSTIPSEYEAFVEHAKLLYTGEYANIAILESNNKLNVAFLMNDFNILSYDEATTEFTAIGWLYCEYTKSSQTWRTVDHTTVASTGINYVKHIRYSSVYWEYNGAVIWPVGAGGGGGGAGLNIAYGDTAPKDTTRLWVKAAEPSVVKITTGMSFTAGSVEQVGILPTAMYGIAAASVGSKAYLFGGYPGVYSDSILSFDKGSNTIVTLDTKLPKAAHGMATAVVGTKVYLFGGYTGNTLNTILVFDTNTQELTTLSTTLPRALMDMAAAAVGSKVYLFGGTPDKTSQELGTILEFDTDTNAITTLSTGLPLRTKGAAAAAVGANVYVFGGGSSYYDQFRDLIYLFNTETGELSELSTKLPNGAFYLTAASVGTEVYLFGGCTETAYFDTVSVFDAATSSITTLGTAIPSGGGAISAVLIDSCIYLFGGQTSNGTAKNTILVMRLSAPLDSDTMIFQYTSGGNLFPIVNSGALTIELCPSSVHIGDENGAAQPVEAFVYKDGAWTAI